MKNFLTLFLSCLGLGLFAQGQQLPVKPLELVRAYQAQGLNFEKAAPFAVSPQKKSQVTELDQKTVDFDVLDVNLRALGRLAQNAPEAMTLHLPAQSQGGTIELLLAKADIFTSDFEVTLASSEMPAAVKYGAHYRGIIKGDPRSVVAISIFENEVMGLISSDRGNLVLGRLQGKSWNGEHVLYDDRNVMHDEPFECGTLDDGIGYKKKDLVFNGDTRAVGDCIRLYIEVDNDIYVDKGGATGATNFTTGLLNEVITLYANENIASVVSQIVLWDVTSPYSSTSSSGMLSDFQANTGSFSGDLGQLLSYQASGGIAAGFAGICNSNPDNSKSFSSINSTYATVPTYSWSVMVVTHEFGHLWGSRHTHACVWNGNNTAIDGCSGSTEGTCPLPGYPSEGGTIMSYCHLQSVGINFNNGFGPQPGNVIRNSVANATCTAPCGPASCDDGIQNGDETGVDCGGPECPACPTCDDGVQNGQELGVDCGGPDCAPCPCEGQDVTLTIVLDNYPEETSWTITSGGLTYASGGPYGGQADGSTVVEVSCLNDGCYEFNIFDSFGDGICCAYGSGSYTLEDASGTVLASGGSFGSSETTNFCLSTTPSLSVSITGTTNVSCNGGSDGSATAAASDGTSPYTYNWSNGATGATISGLSAGSYTVTVTDNVGSTGTATATITEPSALTVTATGTDASCEGASDGSATASSSGGTGTVTYSWSNGATGASISGLGAGTYSVTATDANGCIATDAVTIAAPAPGSACDDGDACTVNDVLDANCNCAGTFQDSDGDGVCDANDACPGFDDSVDSDGDGIPDGCDSNNCTQVTNDFPTNPLTHSGPGSSSTTLAYSGAHQEVAFTISNIDAQPSGNPNNRYTEVVTVDYVDGAGQSQVYGTFSGASVSSVSVSIPGDVLSVTVSLADGYDGNSSITMSIDLSTVSSCDTGGTCPDSDGDGVCDSADVCPGFDDTIDSDGDGIPDGCDSGCATNTQSFPNNPLTHTGGGASSTTLTYPSVNQDVTFTISGIDEKTNGNGARRYTEEVTVTYDDGTGASILVGTFSGASVSSAPISIVGDVKSVTVSLTDIYDDGVTESVLSVDFTDVTSCQPAGLSAPTDPGNVKGQNEAATLAPAGLHLFPNPANDWLVVQFDMPEAATAQMMVVDVNGKAMQVQQLRLDKGQQQSELNVSLLPAGVYSFHLVWKEQRLSKKFVIVR